MRLILFLLALLLPAAHAAPDPRLTGPQIDALVEACVSDDTERVVMLEDGETVCWNSGIFPPAFAAFQALAPNARRMVFSSRGGNVANAILLANRLAELDLPVILAGRCISACTSVIAPGLTNARVHSSAYFLVHGITSYNRRRFISDYIARKRMADGSTLDMLVAGFATSAAWGYYSVQWPRTLAFLDERGIDRAYMTEPEARMQAAKDALACPLELMDYFTVIDRDALRRFLGERLAVIDDFVEDPEAAGQIPFLRRIGTDPVYAYRSALSDRGCS